MITHMGIDYPEGCELQPRTGDEPEPILNVIFNMQRKVNAAHALLLDRIVLHLEEGNQSRAIELCQQLAKELRT